jgi:hypothetical protein
MTSENSKLVLAITSLALVVLVSAASLIYFDIFYPSIAIDRSSPMHAVFLTNGQAFFGHISGISRGSINLDDVYYIQTQVNPQTQERKNILLRRGKEWHGPTEMAINVQSVLLIEPVGTDSEVAKLIAKLKAEAKSP